MIIKYVLTGCLLVLYGLPGYAQTEADPKKTNKITFHPSIVAGVLEGASGLWATVQIVNGVACNNWFAGIGTGLDYYHTRGIPVYIDIKKYNLFNRKSFFGYADAGIHYAWPNQPRLVIEEAKQHFEPGYYFDAGLGYRWMLREKGALLITLGYSGKEIKEKIPRFGFCITTPCPPYMEYFHYRLNRISLKAGIEW